MAQSSDVFIPTPLSQLPKSQLYNDGILPVFSLLTNAEGISKEWTISPLPKYPAGLLLPTSSSLYSTCRTHQIPLRRLRTLRKTRICSRHMPRSRRLVHLHHSWLERQLQLELAMPQLYPPTLQVRRQRKRFDYSSRKCMKLG